MSAGSWGTRMQDEMQTTNDEQATEPAKETRPARRPRGFLLVVVAALAALAGVMAMGQWNIATSVARTGTNLSNNSVATSIAAACLERYLRYAKDGVDRNGWPDFDELLDPDESATPDANDFIPPTAQCDLGVTYVPKSMAAAAEPRQGLHRYCAIRVDQGACLIRYDDNSDDGKTGAVLGPATDADEGGGAVGGDNPRKDVDYSVIVTAIGLYPAKTTNPVDELYERAEARSTKRALIQIEVQASPTGWPSVHAKDTLTLLDGPGNGNYAYRSCGAGGVSAGNLVTGEAQDGCTCGFHALSSGSLDGDDGSCTCSGVCATGAVSTTPKVVDVDNVTDNLDWSTGATATDGEFDHDTPPPVPAKPSFANMAAPGNAFANTFNAQISATTNVPAHVTGSAANPICTYFFAGAHEPDPIDLGPPFLARPNAVAPRTSAVGRGRVFRGAPGCSNTAPHTCSTVGTVTATPNSTPRMVYIWDHSDTNVQDTFTQLATIYNSAPDATFGNTVDAVFANGPLPTASFLDLNANGVNDDWPVAPINCKTMAAQSLPEPCDWEVQTDGSDNVIGARINLNSCASAYSMCWRPVALMDDNDGNYFLSEGLTGTATREPTDDDGAEVFYPNNGFRVPLVRQTVLNDAVPTTPPYVRYQDFCGQISAHGSYSTGFETEGPLWSVLFDKWRVADDIEDDEWPSRGTYWIFNLERDTAARAVDIGEDMHGGGGGGRLKIGIVVDGPIEFANKEYELCCPTCDCNTGPVVDPLDISGTLGATKEIHSSGFALFARGGCYFGGRVKKLNGDILCEFVGMRDNGPEPERVFSDVFATNSCGTSAGCTPSPVSLGNFPSWCNHPTWFPAGTAWDDFGICFEEKTSNRSNMGSRNPWVGYLWSRGDVILKEDNAVTAPRAIDPQDPAPLFPVAGGPPEWPVIFSLDDIGLGEKNFVYGKVLAGPESPTGGNLISVGKENEIFGRLVSWDDITFDEKNRIEWNGLGSTTVAVDDSVSYLDLGW